MEVLQGFVYGLSVSLSPANLLACFVGVFVGTLIGVLPGLGPAATLSLLFPVTYTMSPTASIIMMAGVYYGAMYGGSTTAILLNIPGEAASVVTTLDGYQMARQGRAGPALGIAAMGSFIGGTFSVVALMFLAPPLASLALQFGPPEIAGLLVLSLSLVVYLSSKSRAKAITVAVAGMLLAMVGQDPITGTPRFTHGITTLMDGIGLVPLVMGLFGIAEVLQNVEQRVVQTLTTTRLGRLLPSRRDWADSAWPIARGSVLGFVLGALPGMGAMIPSFMSYALEKRFSRRPDRFGTGVIEGVAGPETANNSATAGSLVPLLTLGIPPNVVMAILVGAFLVHGIQPGPLLITEHPEIFWGVIGSMYIGNAMLLVLNLPLIGIWIQLLRVPYRFLFPVIVVLAVVGAYSESNNVADIVVMVVFGVVGYAMRKLRYEPAPLVLAFVLTRMVEESVRQSLLLSRGNFAIFLDRPLAATFLAGAVLMLGLPMFRAAVRCLYRLRGKLRPGDGVGVETMERTTYSKEREDL